MSERPLTPELELMQVLWAVDHALDQLSHRMEREVGLTGPQRLVVRLLGHSPGAAPGELARMLHLHAATVTGILKRLEARGLVERAPDPWDRRRSQVRLSKKGRKYDAPHPHTVEAAVGRVLARMSRQEVAAARQVLVALQQELTAEPAVKTRGRSARAAPRRAPSR